jgi:SNF family Na+-dependent transporter
MKEKKDYFLSRYAFLFATFGIAIGVGIMTSINGIPSTYF